jgi:hypothetical protein
MTDNAPERIWAAYADYRKDWGNWQATDVGLPRPTEYIRADLCDPMQDKRVRALVKAIEEHATHTLNGNPYSRAMRKVFTALAAISNND